MKKQKAIESVWLAKTLSVILAVLILVAMYLVPTSAAELTADGASASTVAHSVNAEFTASIPAYVMPGEPGEVSADYTVTLENAVIPDNHELTAKVEYSGSMTEQNGVELPYVLTDATGNTIASGTKILTKSAGASDESVSVSFGAELTSKARYAGVYTDTAVFTFDTVEKVYTLDEINADEHLYGIGKTKPEYVIAKFNDDYSEVTVFKNGENSDGIMKGFTTGTGRYGSPFTFNAGTLKDAIVKDGVINISDYAFKQCILLENVAIPDSVTSIGWSAFKECKALKSITIPDSVTNIDKDAFYRCSTLMSVIIGNSVTSIESFTFYECYSLENITIPDSVTSIGREAFYSCRKLTNVTIGNGVTSIDRSAFDYSLPKNIFVGANNKNYCDVDGVLFNKDTTKLICCPAGKIGNYVIPDGVTSIESRAFYRCLSLINITIPNSVTSIGDDAFESCSKLKSITIPDRVTSIGDDAFAYCSALENIFVDTGNENYCDIDGVLFNKNATQLIRCPQRRSGNYVIPDGVTSVSVGAFFYCSLIESVTIPDSVTSIHSNAFNVCNKLKTVYGVSGSYAETFAAENGYTFVAQ